MEYEWFDYNLEKKGRPQSFSKLITQLGTDWLVASAFPEKQILQIQTGAIRTNCLDSLDRTNQMQAIIAREVLRRQLSSALVPSAGASFELPPAAENWFTAAWVRNGDVLSLLYAGTRALASECVVNNGGRRSLSGMLADGNRCLFRYYINHFCDGYYQDCVDLAAGTIQPARDKVKRRSVFQPIVLTVFCVSFP